MSKQTTTKQAAAVETVDTHGKNALELALEVDKKYQNMAKAVAGLIRKSGVDYYTKADAKRFVEALKAQGVKAPAARKRLSRVRSVLEQCGVKVEKDSRGGDRSGSRAPQTPTGETGKPKADKGTADESKSGKSLIGAVQKVRAAAALLPFDAVEPEDKEAFDRVCKAIEKHAQEL